MFNDIDTIQRYLLRHPDNTNLHLHYDDTFEGLPVMIDKGPFIQEHLSRLKYTIDLALAQYPRLMAFRVDLHLPKDFDSSDYANTNKIISRFIESFNAKIQHHRSQLREQKKDARDCKVRYVWAREVGWGGKPHYHLVFLLNRNAYYSVGKFQSLNRNMIVRLQEAWASALRLPVWLVEELVHIPDNATYRIDLHPRERRSDRKATVDDLSELFRRASYLCKVTTKSYGYRQRSFDTSRG